VGDKREKEPEKTCIVKGGRGATALSGGKKSQKRKEKKMDLDGQGRKKLARGGPP